mgnify:CR=1 FL=1
MKRIICVLALVFSTQGYSNSTAELFKAGNEAYKAENYLEAVQIYDSLLSLNYESVDLYYNLGNSHYKQENLGLAILNYERAARLNPNDEDVQNNLNLAREAVLDKFETVPSSILKIIGMATMKFFSPSTWAVMGIVFLFLMGGGVGLYFFTSQKRPGFVGGISFLILGGFSIAMAFSYSQHLKNHVPAIIISDSSYVKSAPSETAEDVFILHEGTKAEVQDELEGWKKIRLIDGKLGWIEGGDLEEI